MELTDKRIMVIGGAGLIGSHIVDQLVDEPVREIVVVDNFVRGTHRNLERVLRSPKVKIVGGSMTDREFLARQIEGVDGVYLLAALWLGECVAEPRSAIEVNVMGTWNVIETCLKSKVARVVFSSSASVYGNALSIPMTEEHPFNNRTMYGATKIAGEQFFRAMYEQHKLPYVGMRYMNIYGPRMDYKGTYVSVIMKVLDRIEQGLPPIILLMLWYNVVPPLAIVLVPFVVILAAVFALGVGLWIAALNVEYRDVRVIVPFVLQLAMYETPVVYPLSKLPERYRPLILANPMTGIVETFRAAVFGSPLPVGPLVWSVVASILVFVGGAFYFRRMEKMFADVL